MRTKIVQYMVIEELNRVLLLDSPLPQLLSLLFSYETYVSIFCFRYKLFKEAPVIPAAFLIHEENSKLTTQSF